MTERSVRAGITVLSLTAMLVGCTGQGPVTPTSLGQLMPTPPPPLSTSPTVAGTAWLHSENGVEPAWGVGLWAWVEGDWGGGTGGRIAIGPDGRFRLTFPTGVKRVRLTGDTGYQPCAVTVGPDDTTADVHLIVDHRQLGANLPSALRSRQPTLSGWIYEQTPEGRRPIPSVHVDLYGSDDVPIADTVTDAEGRYVLCAVPHLPGLALAAGAHGFAPYSQASDLIGKTTLDIELRRNGGNSSD